MKNTSTFIKTTLVLLSISGAMHAITKDCIERFCKNGPKQSAQQAELRTIESHVVRMEEGENTAPSQEQYRALLAARELEEATGGQEELSRALELLEDVWGEEEAEIDEAIVSQPETATRGFLAHLRETVRGLLTKSE